MRDLIYFRQLSFSKQDELISDLANDLKYQFEQKAKETKKSLEEILELWGYDKETTTPQLFFEELAEKLIQEQFPLEIQVDINI